MIGYVCKYTPIEIFQCFDEDPLKLQPEVSSFDIADSITHSTLCTYSKAVIEYVLDNKIDKLVLTNCCDSIKRSYDVLKEKEDIKFIHFMDLPRKQDPLSINKYKDEIKKLIKAYEEFSGLKFDFNKFISLIDAKSPLDSSNDKSSLNLALMGARSPEFINRMLESHSIKSSYDFTCTSPAMRNMNFAANYKNLYSSNSSNYEDEILYSYAESLLNIYPCMRMSANERRYKALDKAIENIDGIIYHTVKFCDNYSFEYAYLKDKYDVPILKIETDYTEQSEGQIKTRLEAFIESIEAKKKKDSLNISKGRTVCSMCKGEISHSNHEDWKSYNIKAMPFMSTEYILGIDSGSTSTNAVIIDENENIVSYAVVRTGAKSIESAKKAFHLVLEKAHLKDEDISLIVSTGYGRISIPFAHMDVTEITCHGKGAYHLNKNVRTIIDIGGQDSKVIKIDERGDVIDFAMNDKCAAGTGRFLEMMAKTLEVPLDHLGEVSLKWKEDIKITNMCSVFAESEVISLIAQNKEKSDIIHGLHNSISNRIVSLLGRTGKKGAYMMTGGVAKNLGVIKALEEKLGEKIYVYKQPEIVGALGAALIGYETMVSKIKKAE